MTILMRVCTGGSAVGSAFSRISIYNLHLIRTIRPGARLIGQWCHCGDQIHCGGAGCTPHIVGLGSGTISRVSRDLVMTAYPRYYYRFHAPFTGLADNK